MIAKLWLLTVMMIVTVSAAARLSNVLSLFAMAGIIAYLLMPSVQYLERKLKTKRALTVTIVFCLFLLLFTLTLTNLVPKAISQGNIFLRDFSRYVTNASVFINGIISDAKHSGVPEGVTDMASELLKNLNSYVYQFIITTLSSILSYSLRILDIVMLLILFFYMLLDGPKIINIGIEYLPSKYHGKINEILVRCNEIFWGYLKVLLIISMLTGVTVYIGLTILGVDYALTLGLLTFVLNFIPYIGSIIAGVVTIVVALFSGSVTKVIVTAIFVLVVQQVWGNIVNPKMQAKSSGMHPIAIIFAILACNQLWGPMGMFIAVPAGGFLRLVLHEAFEFLFRDSKETS